MISNDQADTIADELLEQVRVQRLHAPAPVRLFYRSPELMALEPALRPLVVRHAYALLRTDPQVILALVAYCGAVIAALLAIVPQRMLPLAVVALLPVVLVRNLLVRRTARRLATELLARG